MKRLVWTALLLSVACGQGAPPTPSGTANVATGPAASPSPRRAPNFIVILFDDGRLDDFGYMPTLQRELVNEGVTFTSAYAPTALCTPSRASLLTGMYSHNHRVFSNDPPRGGYVAFRDHEPDTIAAWLQRAGYRTILAGKYMNQYDDYVETEFPRGWDEGYIPVPGYQQFDYTLRMKDGWEYHGEGNDDFEGDVIFDKAIDAIRRTPPAQPFFVYLTPLSPHLPHQSAHRFAGSFLSTPFVPPPSFNEDASDKEARLFPPLLPDEQRVIEETWRDRVRSMLAPDEKIAQLVQALRATGRLEDTYIIATSDNGWFLGEHRYRLGKTAPYEPASHMPLIVRGPGVPARSRLDHPVSLVDLAPTMLELARQPIPPTVDGISLVPLLTSTPAPLQRWREAVLYETIPWFQAIRTVDHAYIEWSSSIEVYDMKKDPHQLENLVYFERLPPEFPRLQSVFNRLSNCRGVGCQ
jgi:N-acetylglucosamine-6-sulfatase